MANPPQRTMLRWFYEEWLTNRAIFGNRRHPLLAGAQKSVDDLQELGVACRLIYDRARGGRVDDPILPRHPDSGGRSNEMASQAVMPELKPSRLIPMDGVGLAQFKDGGTVHPYDAFRGWTNDAHALFPRYPDKLRILRNGSVPWAYQWVPKRLKTKDLDGRSKLLIANSDERSGFAIVLARSIDLQADTWTLHVEIEDLETEKNRKHLDDLLVFEAVGAMALIVAVDGERTLRRAREATPRPNVAIAIHRSSNEIIDSAFVRDVYFRLELRIARIEPEGWDSVCQIAMIL